MRPNQRKRKSWTEREREGFGDPEQEGQARERSHLRHAQHGRERWNLGDEDKSGTSWLLPRGSSSHLHGESLMILKEKASQPPTQEFSSKAMLVVVIASGSLRAGSFQRLNQEAAQRTSWGIRFLSCCGSRSRAPQYCAYLHPVFHRYQYEERHPPCCHRPCYGCIYPCLRWGIEAQQERERRS